MKTIFLYAATATHRNRTTLLDNIASGFSWEWPWLLLATPLPWLARRLLPPAKERRATLVAPFFARVAALPTAGARGGAGNRTLLYCLWAVWLLLVLACSRPIWLGQPVEIPLSGRDLMLVVDISGSMKTRDMRYAGDHESRLAAVKRVVGEFSRQRTGDRLGLILFGTSPHLHTPLTFDHATLRTLLEEAQIGFAGEKTGIGDALVLSVKHLVERPAQSRVVILLTDGADTASEIPPLQAARIAAEQEVKIYTIGVGADEMVVQGMFFSRRVNPASDLDEKTLSAIANITGGRYFRARNPEQLAEIYALLNQLEETKQESEISRPKSPLYPWPLAAALALSLGLAGYVTGMTRPKLRI